MVVVVAVIVFSLMLFLGDTVLYCSYDVDSGVNRFSNGNLASTFLCEV